MGKKLELHDLIEMEDDYQPYSDEFMKKAWEVAEGGVTRVEMLNIANVADKMKLNKIINTRLIIDQSARWGNHGEFNIYIKYWFVMAKPPDAKAKADKANKTEEGFKAEPAAKERVAQKLSESAGESDAKAPGKDEGPVDGLLPEVIDQGNDMEKAIPLPPLPTIGLQSEDKEGDEGSKDS